MRKLIDIKDKKRYLSLIINVITKIIITNIIFKRIIKIREVKEIIYYIYKAT